MVVLVVPPPLVMAKFLCLPDEVLRIIFSKVGVLDMCALRAVCRTTRSCMGNDDPLLALRRLEWRSGLLSNPAIGDLRERACYIEEYAKALVRGRWELTHTVAVRSRNTFVRCFDKVVVYLTQVPNAVEVNVWRLPSVLKGVAGETYKWILTECERVHDVYEIVVDVPGDMISFLFMAVESPHRL